MAALPLCQGQRKSSKRQGGLWLQLGQKHLPCEGAQVVEVFFFVVVVVVVVLFFSQCVSFQFGIIQWLVACIVAFACEPANEFWCTTFDDESLKRPDLSANKRARIMTNIMSCSVVPLRKFRYK